MNSIRQELKIARETVARQRAAIADLKLRLWRVNRNLLTVLEKMEQLKIDKLTLERRLALTADKMSASSEEARKHGSK